MADEPKIINLKDGKPYKVWPENSIEDVKKELENAGYDPDEYADQLNSIFGSSDDFASDDMVDTKFPEEMDDLLDRIFDEGIDTKEQNRRADLYVKMRNDILIKHPELKDQLSSRVKRKVSDAVLKQLVRLRDIETTDDPLSIANWGVQNLGEFLNMNKDLTGYKQGKEQLKIPILRKILEEKGATMQAEQLTGEKLGFPGGTGVFSKNIRPELLENTFENLSSLGGFDMREIIEKNNPQLLKDIGAFPSGSPFTLKNRAKISKDEFGKLGDSDATGPAMSFGEGLVNITPEFIKNIFGYGEKQQDLKKLSNEELLKLIQ